MSATLAAVLAWAMPAAPPEVWLATRLTVSPAAAPDPALEYELLPRLADRTPGDAATRYNRAFLIHVPDVAKPDPEKHKGWLAAPADKFPTREVKEYLAKYALRFREVEHATRADRCDWELLERSRAEGFNTQLPEAVGARDVAPLLALRARVESAEGRLDGALHTLRTGFQLAKHVGEAPVLLNHLVGLSVAGHMADRLEELVQKPGAPNLYWALAGLPRPLIELRPTLEGEEFVLRGTFPMIDELSKGPVSEERANAAVKEFFRAAERLAGDKPNDKRNGALIAGVVPARHAAAKKGLIARGRPAEEVERMPPAQAVFLHAWVRYRDLQDDLTKWFRLPPPVALDGLLAVEVRTGKAKRKVTAESDLFMAPFLLTTSGYYSVLRSHVRLERRLAALRAVEALRLHAAKAGRWPAKLEEVKEVAVPDDPFTGRAFLYKVKGDKATLTGPPLDRSNVLRYELTVRPVK